MKTLFFSMLCALSLQAGAPSSYTLVEERAELEILNPTLSERKTAKLRLANGLQAYIISDPHLPKSAAALAVQAGSWDDPEQYPGMAHFLEHMLFMGNEAYPKEFEYMQFINENGGMVNAYTASDRTVYMFSINNDRFEGALDRFSHFFIDPLFLPSCINRELHAVDQEHSKNIEHDGWRQYMIFKETANGDHPCAKFSTGNADTLGGIPQDAMKQWYKEHYSANKMHLVLYSALPLDELIELANERFCAVATSEKGPVHFSADMISEKQKGKLVYIKPVKDIKVLSLTWELSEELALDIDSKAGDLLAYILKNGGKNSLLGSLKQQHLAENVSASEDSFSPTNKIFTLDVELTEKGVKQIHTVINCCFEALARLKKTGIPRYIFDELKTIQTVGYAYQSREDAFSYVSTAAHRLVDEPLETFPQKTLTPTEYKPERYTQYLDALTPQSCVYFVMADPQISGVVPDKSEKWMGAEYCVQTIDSKQINAWGSTGINPQIGLPLPNAYVPKNLDLIHQTFSKEAIHPTLLTNAPCGKIYYSDDTQYLTPQTNQLFRIKSPYLDGSAKQGAYMDLYLKSVYDALFPISQAAESAGSKISFSHGKFALMVGIEGYSEPSARLCENVFEGLKKVKPTHEQFNLYKASLLSHYENASKELPVFQSLEMVSSVLFNDAPTNEEKYQALKKISYEEFLQFSANLLKKAYVEGLIYGNLSKEEAEHLSSSLFSILNADPYLESDHHTREILLLPQDRGPFMLTQTTPMQGNAAVLVIQQGPYSFDRRASQEVLAKVIRNEFFETLRTKQQTAYFAKAWEKEEEMQLLQLFAVQSSSHLPHDLISRFELFLEDFVKQYTTHMPPERFENVRQMAIRSLEMPPENLTGSAARLFTLAFDYGGDFDLIDKRIRALQALTYEQTQQEAIATLSRLNKRRLAILLEGAAQKDREFRYETTSKKDLRAGGRFVTKNELLLEQEEAVR